MQRPAVSRKSRVLIASLLSMAALAAHAGQPPCDNKTVDPNSSVACGVQALANNVGYGNSAFGRNALAMNTTGLVNAAFGFDALMNNSGGTGNAAFGSAALEMNTTGSGNTGIGNGALALNSTGTSNTAVGNDALSQGSAGFNNTAVGAGAIEMDRADSYNVGVGVYSLQLNSSTDGSASYNTAIGGSALRSVTGTQNTAVGAYSLGSGYVYPSTHASFNTSIGAYSLQVNSSGSSNVAVGTQTLVANTTGSQNNGVGFQALARNTTGTKNVAIGYQAGYYSQGSNNVYVSNAGNATDNGVIRIGDPAAQTSTYVAGIFKTNITGGANVVVSATGQLGVVSSSRRYKEAIEPMADHGTEIYALRPVTFRYRQADESGNTPVQYGLIAEEVAQSFPDLVVYNEAGEPETVRYQELTPILLNEVQKLHTQVADVDSLKARLAAQDGELRELREQMADLAALNRGMRVEFMNRKSATDRVARQ